MAIESPQNNTINGDEISLKELVLSVRNTFSYLFSKWIIILSFGVLGGILGFFYASSKKPVYFASTTFVLEDEKGGGGLGNLAGLASMAGVDLAGSGGGIFQGDNILQLYASRSMVQQTLLTEIDVSGKKQLLVDRYLDFNKIRKKWAENKELVGLQFSNQDKNRQNDPKLIRLRDSILGVIVNDLNKSYLNVSKPDKKLSTIQVDVKCGDEIFAKNFNDELVKNVNEFYVNTKTKKTLLNVQILQHKTDSVRAVMNGAIYSSVAIGDATPNLNPTRLIQRAAPVQKAQFSAETNRAILAEMIKNLEVSKMSLLKETPLIQVIDQPIYPLRKDVFSKLKGIILGGFVLGSLSVIYLIFKITFKKILSE